MREYEFKIYASNCPTRCNYIQFFIPLTRTACFGWYLHPSSGAHVTVSTASGISKTVTAACRECDCTSSHVHDRLQLR